MKIVFATNTVALVGGVQQHFAAGEHDVQPDDDAQKLVDAGDAKLPEDVTAVPTGAQKAAAEAAEAQRLAEEAEAQRLAEEQAMAEAAAKEQAEAQAQAEAEKPAAQAAQPPQKGGKRK